eukprot:GEMP01025127.1.p2 GENE.GEMP01025127.1~~GEMP01025127.1.p2  ORF type:complete len:358 (+),score=91.52 GEMP01025127.1:29-1102(+)
MEADRESMAGPRRKRPRTITDDCAQDDAPQALSSSVGWRVHERMSWECKYLDACNARSLAMTKLDGLRKQLSRSRDKVVKLQATVRELRAEILSERKSNDAATGIPTGLSVKLWASLAASFLTRDVSSCQASSLLRDLRGLQMSRWTVARARARVADSVQKAMLEDALSFVSSGPVTWVASSDETPGRVAAAARGAAMSRPLMTQQVFVYPAGEPDGMMVPTEIRWLGRKDADTLWEQLRVPPPELLPDRDTTPLSDFSVLVLAGDNVNTNFAVYTIASKAYSTRSILVAFSGCLVHALHTTSKKASLSGTIRTEDAQGLNNATRSICASDVSAARHISTGVDFAAWLQVFWACNPI